MAGKLKAKQGLQKTARGILTSVKSRSPGEIERLRRSSGIKHHSDSELTRIAKTAGKVGRGK